MKKHEELWLDEWMMKYPKYPVVYFQAMTGNIIIHSSLRRVEEVSRRLLLDHTNDSSFQ